ncbi:MAG TPA: right-handed parallel beta-helix repeat-containing protein, partial [Anaerolineae bacterium]|nr:right-handed parallel beta-helix repeat-containing protein [Anaerolineae bacterium]
MKSLKCSHQWLKLGNMGLVGGLVVLWLLGCLVIPAAAASPGDGPGGVGETDGLSALRWWFKTDAGVYADFGCTTLASTGGLVACWADQSGHGEAVLQSDADYRPLYRTASRLEFDTAILTSTQPVQLFANPSAGLSAIVVFNTNNYTNTGVLVNHGASDGADNDLNFELGYTVGNPTQWGNFGLHRGGGRATVAPQGTITNSTLTLMSTLVLPSGTTPLTSLAIYKNGAALSLATNSGGWLTSGSYPTTAVPLDIGARRDGNDATYPDVAPDAFHSGEIAEIIIYTTTLNSAQRTIVENYLAAKYGITLNAAAAKYISLKDYNMNVAGIGREADGMHTHASSAGLQVTDAGFLQDNGDYLLIGHKSVANFIAGTQLPLGVQSRWERSWYFDFSDTGTTGGKVTLTFDFSDAGISETPSGIYVLLGRNTTASRFQIVQTSSYIVGDQVIFKDTPALRDDWYYTLGEAANRDYYIADSHQPGGPTPAFEDIRSSGILIGAFSSGSDDQTVIAPINFTFNFYDRGYVTATVSSNGFVGFNSTTAGAGTPPAIPNTANPNGVVAGWWMDLDARVAGATVHYTTTGIAPLRVFIVQYTNVPRVGTSITSTFQIKLFESTDQIEVHYLHANTNAAVGAGIENQDGVKGLQYYYANASLRDVAVRYSRPELLIDKTVNESIPRVGERITYTLVLRSNLAFATTATVVTDTLDAGLTFDTGALTIAPAQPFNYTLNGQVLELRDFNIQAGGRVTFTLPVTVSPSATPGVELTNQAVMTHSDLSELRSTMVDVMPDNCWVRVGSTTYNNLQAGLDAAAPGAEVKIAGHCVDVVARNGLEQVGYLSKTLTLRGGYAPGDVDWTTAYPTRTTVLNAHGDGRVLYMYDASASISVTLENLHLINGDAGQSGSVDSYGGGLYANAALLTLRQVQIYQNLADRGGGVYMLTGTLSLRDSRVFSNTADTRGGGLALFNVRALLWQQSEVLSNTAGLGGATAGMGGGLYLEDTPAWMQGGRIAGNQADVANKSDRGGGLYILRKSLSLTSGVSIVDNMAYWGGGVYADACVVTVTGGTVASNMAFQGAGLYLDAGASELRSNTFMGNHAWGTGDARYGGGGLYTLNVPVRLTENVFISNTAATGGAGALLEGADMFIHDNAFTTNTAARSQGGGLYIVTGSTATLTLNHFISNTAGNGGGGAYVNNTLWISVTANEFMSNTANSGGGLYLKSALMQVQDNQLVANLATSQGGGMFLERGAVVVVRNLLLRNLATASHGGGAFFSYANGQVLTNTWEFNSSGARGGGFYMGTSGSFTVRNNDFLTNTANAGGGVAIVTGIMTLEDNRFEGNIAVGGSFGGGGLLLDRTLLWMKHNVFTANTTTGNHGGALYLVQPTGGTVISNTFVNNTAPTGQGGGVYFNNVDVLTFTLNLVVENTANGAGGGAAVVNGSVGLWIVDNIVQANQHTSSANGGGGIYITGSQPNLERNQIMFNTTMRDGGGIFFGGSNGAVMTNTVISNTATRYGGGVYVGSNPMTFIGNTVTENQAEFGGGFYLYQSTGLFQRNTIRQNTSSNHGGGVYGINGRAILEDNTIDLNTTPQNGGGIYLNVPTDIAVRANRIVSNTASQGGGVYVYRGASSTVSHNTIAYNLATRLTDAGAGAYVMNLNNSGVTAFMFAYNTFRANTTPGQGGGLYINNADSATLNANQFLENTAQGGGGIWLLGSESLLTNNLLVDNIITERGSGIYVEGSSPRILHSTLVGNTGGDGSGICVTRATYFSSPMITNTIMVNQTVGVTATTGNLATLNGTLWWLNGAEWGGSVTADANYYGNPEFVNAAGGDYHITLNSPALNVGLDSGVASDMDAEPRPQYGGYDLGADEYAGSCFVKLNDDDYMYTSIQDAVDASTQATDLIKVAGTCATVKFTGGTLQTVYINKSLTIRGGYTLTEWVNPDAALYPTTLGARGLGRVAFVNVGVVTIEDVWITGGDAAAGGSSVNGGGVYVNASATLTLRNVTLENNHADNGAGVYSNYATLLVEDSLIADNGAALDGGGLYALNGQVSFLRSTLRGNTAGNGGGLYLSGSIATLRNNTWNSNSVTGEGGALYLNGVTSLAFEANLVRDNSAASGGGMYLYQSPVTLERSHFISNTVTRGGGLYLNASNAALINTVIANNTSTDRG